MYLEFFKFEKIPFDKTPDQEFLFLSSSHREASASVFYGIQGRKGIVAVIGEVGVGKTTILRSYLNGTDPEKIKIVYISDAALSFDKMLKQICSALGIQTEVEDEDELFNILFHHLLEEYRKDRNVALILDEAENIPFETFERLRMLSNLETSRDKLIQIILVGQPELEARLNQPELRLLKQRIAVRTRIEALTDEEGIAYIQHRVMRASTFHNAVFTKEALRLISKKAGGNPRKLNLLCDNALVTAFEKQRKPVDEKIVKKALRKSQVKQKSSDHADIAEKIETTAPQPTNTEREMILKSGDIEKPAPQPTDTEREMILKSGDPEKIEIFWMEQKTKLLPAIQARTGQILDGAKVELEQKLERKRKHAKMMPKKAEGLLTAYRAVTYQTQMDAWEKENERISERCLQLERRVELSERYQKKNLHCTKKGERLAEQVLRKIDPELARELDQARAREAEQRNSESLHE